MDWRIVLIIAICVVAVVVVISIIAGIIAGIHIYKKDKSEYETKPIFNFYCF